MRTHAALLAMTIFLAVPIHSACATDNPQPEIQRETSRPQLVGLLHTLRNIPEACVRLQGEFSGVAGAPYHFDAVPRDRCAARAKFVAADTLHARPSIADSWILNDVIRVPNAACPDQIAVVSVWRKQIDPTNIPLDSQGRMRIYMKDGNVSTPSGQQAHAISLYTATLEVRGSCG